MSRLIRYREALRNISVRTGSPLSSLITSFAIVHEITAIVPFVALFFGARSLGIGEHVVDMVQARTGEGEQSWMVQKCDELLREGEQWTGRVGRRYGLFGYEKGVPAPDQAVDPGASKRIAGDVANAVFAYGVTKALFPLRVGLALYLAPSCSRLVVEPLRQFIIKPFRRP